MAAYTQTHLRVLARLECWKVPAEWVDAAVQKLGHKDLAACTKEEALAIAEELIDRKDNE